MRRSIAVFSLFAVLLCVSAARAAPIQDASFEGQTHGLAFNGVLYRAQTFTVGTSGLFTGFEVLMSSDTGGTSAFEIWSTIGGVPQAIPGTALASGTAVFGSGNTWVGDDTSSFGLYVTVGDVLALVQIGSYSIGSGAWPFAQNSFLAPSSRYSGGSAYTTNASGVYGPWILFAPPLGYDFAFRTYVDPVPIPAAVWLFGSALGVLSLGRRRSVR